MSLAGAYKAPNKDLVAPLDERFAFNSKDTFQRGTNVFLKDNLLYEPNMKVLNDVPTTGTLTTTHANPSPEKAIEYNMSPERNALSIKLREEVDESEANSPEQPRREVLIPRGGTYVSSANAVMDEECRHDLPPPKMIIGSMDVGGEESKEDSPQKSVRFTEGGSSPDTHLKARPTVGD